MSDATPSLFAQDQARNTQPSISLWYATDLSRWEDATVQIACDQDLVLQGKAYRRLTPEYYAWLRSRMTHAQEKHRRGLLPATVYNQLRARFNVMHDDAIQLYGEATLLSVLESLDLQGYEPPSAQTASRLLALLQDAQSAEATPQEFYSGSGSARALLPDPTAPPNLAVGVPVRMLGGGEGVVTVIHAAEAELPGGWVEITTTDGQRAQADTRYLTDMYGRRFVPMTYTPYEQRAMALAVDERPEDFDDILPDLNYPTTGTWRFTEKVDLLDYFKVEEIKDTAMGLGWSHADLFQNRGRLAMPCGQDYGLICFVHGRAIGAVTAEAIELFPEKGNRDQCTRFQRPRRQEVTHGSTHAT
ncbi:MAG: hypothetical protein ACYDBB_01530 [Armatimonadota bacterium]